MERWWEESVSNTQGQDRLSERRDRAALNQEGGDKVSSREGQWRLSNTSAEVRAHERGGRSCKKFPVRARVFVCVGRGVCARTRVTAVSVRARVCASVSQSVCM